MIVPGLEQLVDPSADPADLIALADVQARRLRAELESPDRPDAARVCGRRRVARPRGGARVGPRPPARHRAADPRVHRRRRVRNRPGARRRSPTSPAAPHATCATGPRSTSAPARSLLPALEHVTAQATRARPPACGSSSAMIGTQPPGEQVAGARRRGPRGRDERPQACGRVAGRRPRRERRRGSHGRHGHRRRRRDRPRARRAEHAGSACRAASSGACAASAGTRRSRTRPAAARCVALLAPQGRAMRIRVIVVDDFPLVREGVARALDSRPGHRGHRAGVQRSRGARARRAAASPTS